MNNKDVFTLTWCNIDIEVAYVANDSEAFKRINGYAMSHIEVRSVFPKDAPLPITETGYRSIFIIELELAEYGGAKALVLSMLEEGAKSSSWRLPEDACAQFSLF